MPRDLQHRAAFESQGETCTRVLAQQNDDVGGEAKAWLAERQAQRDEAASALRDAREEETLLVARQSNAIAAEALTIANSANRIASDQSAVARKNGRWAIYAAIVSTVSIAVSAKDHVLALIFGAP
jgi:hypothetical protein